MADEQRNFQVNVNVEGVEELDRIAASFERSSVTAEQLTARIAEIEELLRTKFRQVGQSDFFQVVDKLGRGIADATPKVHALIQEYQVLLDVNTRLAEQAERVAAGRSIIGTPVVLGGKGVPALGDKTNPYDIQSYEAGEKTLQVQQQITAAVTQQATATERVGGFIASNATAAAKEADAVGRAAVSAAEEAAWTERIARNRAAGIAASGAGAAVVAPGDPRKDAIGVALARDQEQVNALIARLAELRAQMDRLPANQQQKLASQYQSVNDTIQRVIQRHQQLFAALERTPPRNLQQGMEQVDRVADQTQRDVLRLQQALARLETSYTNVGSAAQGSTQKMGYLAKAAENVLVYGTLYRVFSELTNSLGKLAEGFVTNTAEASKFVAVEGRLVGSSTEAAKRLQEVFTQGLDVGIPLADLEKLDTRLAELGITAQTSQRRFGLSLGELRGALTDLAQLPGLDLDKVTEFFTRSADGANRLALSLASAGVTSVEELKQYGVVFDRTSNNIISSSDQTTRAVLAIWRAHYSGLSEETAHTWDGVQTRTANSMDEIEATVGKDVFARITAQLDAFLQVASDPSAHNNLEQIGKDLGQVYDFVSKAVVKAWELRLALSAVGELMTFNPDAFGAIQDIVKLDQQTTKLGELAEAQLAVNNTAKDLPPILDRAADSAESIRQRIAALQAVLTDTRDVMSGVKDDLDDVLTPIKNSLDAIKDKEQIALQAADVALSPLRDKLQDIKDRQEQVNTAYQAALRPIQDAERSLERQYQTARQLHDLNRLERDVARDKLLGLDLNSQEGRAAALRLPDELDRLQQQKDEIAYNAGKNKLQDTQTSLERAKQTTDAALKTQEDATNATIHRIESVRDAIKLADDAAVATYQHRIDALQGVYKTVNDNVTHMEHSLTNQIHDLQASAGTATAAAKEMGVGALSVVQQVSTVVMSTVAAAARLMYPQPRGNAIATGGFGGGLGNEEYKGEPPFPVPRGNANATAAFGMGGTINTTLTLIMKDPNGSEWFRQELQSHKGDVQAVVVDLLKGNKR